MAVPEPGCCDTDNALLRKILLGLQDVVDAEGGGGGGGGGNVSLTGINGVAPSVGCGVSSTGTLRVAQATDCVVTTSNNNAAGAAAVNIQDGGNSITVDGTVAVSSSALPTGASTSALQTTGNTSLSSIDGKFGTLGQKTMAGSAPVVIASDQSAIPVSGTVTIGTSVTPGTGATNLGKAEDSVAASGDVGVFALGVSNEAQTTLAADGDYIAHATDTKGNHLVVGNIANDGVDAGNPVKIGGIAKTSSPAVVADGDRVNALYNKTGHAVAIGQLREQLGNQATTITSSTAETTIITADATFFLDLYGFIVTNTSATATKVTLKDATAGTTRIVFQVPATETRGFMLPCDSGHKQATVNNNWTATCGTSVSAIEICAIYNKRM